MGLYWVPPHSFSFRSTPPPKFDKAVLVKEDVRDRKEAEVSEDEDKGDDEERRRKKKTRTVFSRSQVYARTCNDETF